MPLTRDAKKGSGKAAPSKSKPADKKPKVTKVSPAPVPPVETQEDLEQDNLLALAATMAPEPVAAPVAAVTATEVEPEALPWENYTAPVEQPQIERTADGKVKMASLIASGRVQPYTPPMDPNLAKLIKLIK